MTDKTKDINTIPQDQTSNIQSDLNPVSVLSSNVTDILNETNSWISDIVRIKELEWKETWLFSWILTWVIDRFNATLWVTLNPATFAEMTETLNKHRKILEMNSADNYTLENKEAA